MGTRRLAVGLPWLLLLAVLIPLVASEDAAAGAFLDQVIALNRVLEPELDEPALRRELAAMAEQVRGSLAKAESPRDRIAVLNRVLLTQRSVSYLSNLTWRDSTLAASALRARGNCLSTSTLYVVVGKLTGLPICLVEIPYHAYARWDDGLERVNVETTDGGKEIPDEAYLTRANRPDPEDVAKLGWCRSLDDNGCLALLTVAAAHHRQSEGRLADAVEFYRRAIDLAPERPDLRLALLQISADYTGRRQEVRQSVVGLLAQPDLAPSVRVSALLWLADEMSAEKDFQRQRSILLEAFAWAPKTTQIQVLHELAFCHRSLKDWRGALRYYELAMALCPRSGQALASQLYNLAILQKNDGQLDQALRSIDHALVLNPEEWNLKVLKAGYLCLAGKPDEGRALFAKVRPPRGDQEFWRIMRAWFHAVSGQRDLFYRHFAEALEQGTSTRTLTWIEQDVDLDPYREEPEFRALVERHRKRILPTSERLEP